MTPKNPEYWASIHEQRCAVKAERVYWGGLLVLVTATVVARVLLDSWIAFVALFGVAFAFFAYGESLAFRCLRWLAREPS